MQLLCYQGCEPVELKEAEDEEKLEEGDEANKEGEEKPQEDEEPKPTPVSRTTQLLKAIKAPLVAVWPKRNKVRKLYFYFFLRTKIILNISNT